MLTRTLGLTTEDWRSIILALAALANGLALYLVYLAKNNGGRK